MTRLLDVQDLSVRFGTVDAVRHVSFHIDKGETVGIVGESGSGKSVSALSILKLLPYPAATHPTGEITFDGTPLLHAPEKVLRQVRGRRIAMIFQEPMTSLNPLHKVGRQIAEVLDVHLGMREAQARARVLELLDLVGIQNPDQKIDAYPHELSGGQRQRVMIAMALACEPDLLIADEPTTALDVTVQAQILTLLKRLRKELGMAMLIISHDLGIVQEMSDRVYVMLDGEVVEEGDSATVFTNPQHDYTQHLLAASPSGAPTPVETSASDVLAAKDVKVWFPIKAGLLRRTVDHVKAVDGICLTVRAGETIGIVGESGSGKTTLGMALLGLVGAKGSAKFADQQVIGQTSAQLRPLRRNMQPVFQDPFGALSPRMSVADIIAEGLLIHEPSMDQSERDDHVCAIMKEVELDPAVRHRYPHEFSGGQRQRISIARAMILRPKLVMLDEPTSALDMSVQAQIVDLLRRLQDEYGLAYLFISHDLSVVRAMSHQVLVMKDGVIVEQAATDQLFDNPQQNYTKALIAAARHLDTAS